MTESGPTPAPQAQQGPRPVVQPTNPGGGGGGCIPWAIGGCLTVIVLLAILFGSLFYFGFMQRGGVYDDLRAQLNQRLINDLVPAIETYKLQHGAYPATLAELQEAQPESSAVLTFDGLGRPFAYERVGEDGYRLSAVGADGKPFTDDDIVPQVDPATADKLGLKNGKPVEPAETSADPAPAEAPPAAP